MNIEVEIKVKIIDFKDIKKELVKLGKLKRSIRQIDEYYVPCHRNFFAHKPTPTEWMRIRKNPDKTIFEYDRSFDKKEGGQYYAKEYETEISQPKEFKKILKFLDFKMVMVVDKHREYWDCGDFEVCLDKVKGLGNFIEVEAKGKFKNSKAAREGCAEFLKKLGIKQEGNEVKTGYPTLLLRNKKI